MGAAAALLHQRPQSELTDMQMVDYISFFQTLAANTLVTGAIAGVAAWWGKGWADRRLEKLRGQNSEQLDGVKTSNTTQLERFKAENTELLERLRADLALVGKRDQAGIDRQMLVFRTHFDVEYKNYQAIWEACDASFDRAAQVLQLYQHRPIDEEANTKS